jgi:hypothetical protein
MNTKLFILAALLVTGLEGVDASAASPIGVGTDEGFFRQNANLLVSNSEQNLSDFRQGRSAKDDLADLVLAYEAGDHTESMHIGTQEILEGCIREEEDCAIEEEIKENMKGVIKAKNEVLTYFSDLINSDFGQKHLWLLASLGKYKNKILEIENNIKECFFLAYPSIDRTKECQGVILSRTKIYEIFDFVKKEVKKIEEAEKSGLGLQQ